MGIRIILFILLSIILSSCPAPESVCNYIYNSSGCRIYIIVNGEKHILEKDTYFLIDPRKMKSVFFENKNISLLYLSGVNIDFYELMRDPENEIGIPILDISNDAFVYWRYVDKDGKINDLRKQPPGFPIRWKD